MTRRRKYAKHFRTPTMTKCPPTGTPIQPSHHQHCITPPAVTVADDGDYNVHLFDAHTRARMRELLEHRFNHIALSPDDAAANRRLLDQLEA